jgi:hypothetical protein
VPIYDEDKIETFQQFTAFNHHVKCPTVHGGLGLCHRCPVTTAYLCHSHSRFFWQTVSASDSCWSQQIFVALAVASPNKP